MGVLRLGQGEAPVRILVTLEISSDLLLSLLDRLSRTVHVTHDVIFYEVDGSDLGFHSLNLFSVELIALLDQSGT